MLPSPDAAHQNNSRRNTSGLRLADTATPWTIEVTAGKTRPRDCHDRSWMRRRDHVGDAPEETGSGHHVQRGWLQGNRTIRIAEGTAAVSTIPGDRARSPFTGTSVSWIGYRGPQRGSPA